MSELNFKNFNPRNLTANINFNLKETFRRVRLMLALFLILSSGVFYFFSIHPPKDFPINVVVEIRKGETLSEISQNFKKNNLIKSSFWFEIATRIYGDDGGVLSGEYFFEEPLNSFSLAKNVLKGKFGLNPIRVTIYEGLSVKEIASLLSKKFNKFDPDEFIKLASDGNKEGYLFPDTYFFLPNIKAPDILKVLEENFYKKITTVQTKIDTSGRKLEDIIIMASLLEKEARTLKTRKIISGILWNRLSAEMPLQVDAVFPYILGKNTYEVTLEDLQFDSKYNTYLYPGLPQGPITNPGINSIIAALEPIESDYYYYLSDKQGNTYYAVDFEGHKRNRTLHLN